MVTWVVTTPPLEFKLVPKLVKGLLGGFHEIVSPKFLFSFLVGLDPWGFHCFT
jgi:hypothetical protein